MKYKQSKPVKNDKDWPSDEPNHKGVMSFGRRMNEGKKSFRTARGGGAAKKGCKHLAD